MAVADVDKKTKNEDENEEADDFMMR